MHELRDSVQRIDNNIAAAAILRSQASLDGNSIAANSGASKAEAIVLEAPH